MRLIQDDGAAIGTRFVLAATLGLALACSGPEQAPTSNTHVANEPDVEVETSSDEPTESSTDEPSTDEPSAEEPGTEEPGTEEPATDEPSAEEEASFRTASFFQHEDAPVLVSLSESPITEVERGHGGRSLGFRVTLEDGTRGYFKPAQSFNGMNWYAEVAAFHLDRELGLGRVAPSIGRRVAFSELSAAAQADGRRDELSVEEDGTLPGVIIWWVPERLHGVELPEGWQTWLLIEGSPPRVTPFQRPNQYRAGTRFPIPDEVPDPDPTDRAAEMSDIIVFDYLIHNVDRFGGNNTNIRTVGDGGPVMFLDNAAGFTLPRPRVSMMDTRLEQVHRFRRSTIDAIRALDVEAYFELLDEDPLGPLLDDRQRRNFVTRRDHLIEYVDELIERFDEDRVYAW